MLAIRNKFEFETKRNLAGGPSAPLDLRPPGPIPSDCRWTHALRKVLGASRRIFFPREFFFLLRPPSDMLANISDSQHLGDAVTAVRPFRPLQPFGRTKLFGRMQSNGCLWSNSSTRPNGRTSAYSCMATYATLHSTTHKSSLPAKVPTRFMGPTNPSEPEKNIFPSAWVQQNRGIHGAEAPQLNFVLV